MAAYALVKYKKPQKELLTKVAQNEVVTEQAYDANDLIRKRPDDPKNESLVDDGDDTKTQGAETLKSRQMTPRKQMDTKDAESMRSFAVSDKIGNQIDNAIKAAATNP